MDRSLYLIPGRDSRLGDLGHIVLELGWQVCGRELRPPFGALGFAEQLERIQSDLKTHFWHDEARLIGHSFGAYLLMHALSELDAFPGQVLLLSPVLGSATARAGDRCVASIPPRAKKLLELAQAKTFPAPGSLEIHTGQDDEGCDPDLAKSFCAGISTARLSLVPNAGHSLSRHYIAAVMWSFLR
jgi:pimeloyl-ACP methyl ester carboxylesterase